MRCGCQKANYKANSCEHVHGVKHVPYVALFRVPRAHRAGMYYINTYYIVPHTISCAVLAYGSARRREVTLRKVASRFVSSVNATW